MYTVGVALIVGLLIGLWAFRVKSRWCPRCGGVTYSTLAGQQTGRGRR